MPSPQTSMPDLPQGSSAQTSMPHPPQAPSPYPPMPHPPVPRTPLSRTLPPPPVPQSPWISVGAGVPDAPVRLFCFPHAGGGSGFFRPWRAALAPDAEVCAVILPGREGRLREPPYTRMSELVGPLAAALDREIDRPYAILGHSTGAAVGYEVARALAAGPAGPPLALVVSGRRPPDHPGRGQRHLLSDDAFLAAVTALGGTPAELLDQPDLLGLFLPSLRADFALNETYTPLPGPPLACPVLAMTGDGDPEVTPEEMAGWRRAGSGPFTLRVFPGEHFYLGGAPADVAAAVRDELRRASAGSATDRLDSGS